MSTTVLDLLTCSMQIDKWNWLNAFLSSYEHVFCFVRVLKPRDILHFRDCLFADRPQRNNTTQEHQSLIAYETMDCPKHAAETRQIPCGPDGSSPWFSLTRQCHKRKVRHFLWPKGCLLARVSSGFRRYGSGSAMVYCSRPAGDTDGGPGAELGF